MHSNSFFRHRMTRPDSSRAHRARRRSLRAFRPHTEAVENRTLISKAGSDAKFVARIDVNRRPGSAVERFYELIPITAAIGPQMASPIGSSASDPNQS